MVEIIITVDLPAMLHHCTCRNVGRNLRKGQEIDALEPQLAEKPAKQIQTVLLLFLLPAITCHC